jgi:hypothetical protein
MDDDGSNPLPSVTPGTSPSAVAVAAAAGAGAAEAAISPLVGPIVGGVLALLAVGAMLLGARIAKGVREDEYRRRRAAVRDAAQAGFVPAALSGLDVGGGGDVGGGTGLVGARPPWAASLAAASSSGVGIRVGSSIVVGISGSGAAGSGGLVLDPRLVRFSPDLARHSFRARRVVGLAVGDSESKQSPPPPSPPRSPAPEDTWQLEAPLPQPRQLSPRTDCAGDESAALTAAPGGRRRSALRVGDETAPVAAGAASDGDSAAHTVRIQGSELKVRSLFVEEAPLPRTSTSSDDAGGSIGGSNAESDPNGLSPRSTRSSIVGQG